MPSPWPLLVKAGAVQDAAGCRSRPGVLAVGADGRVVFAGAADDLPPAVRQAGWPVLECPEHLLVPGMVNAHAHLDLSAIGPQPYRGAFVDWLTGVVAGRAGGDWQAGYRLGLELLRSGGVAAVGDIVPFGHLESAARLCAEAGLHGTVFGELLGVGAPFDAGPLGALAAWKPPAEEGPVRRGLQPHAPYSCSPALYLAAATHPAQPPISTHLAETPEEAEFIARGGGPFKELLERLGRWRPEFAARYAAGASPVGWLKDTLARPSAAPWLAVHVNYADDADLALLARFGAAVAYCPVASEYFGHRGHRWRDMLEYGIPVCLGTDSILCQPKEEAQPLGILPQMRLLFRRDGADPATLLEMATVNGAAALGMADPRFATFRAGAVARPLALRFNPGASMDPLRQALRRDEPAQFLDTLA